MKSYIKNSISEGIALRNQLLQDESTIQDYESECSLTEEKSLNKTEELVIALFKKKYTQKRIAFRIGISQSTVSRIIKKYKESYNLV